MLAAASTRAQLHRMGNKGSPWSKVTRISRSVSYLFLMAAAKVAVAAGQSKRWCGVVCNGSGASSVGLLLLSMECIVIAKRIPQARTTSAVVCPSAPPACLRTLVRAAFGDGCCVLLETFKHQGSRLVRAFLSLILCELLQLSELQETTNSPSASRRFVTSSSLRRANRHESEGHRARVSAGSVQLCARTHRLAGTDRLWKVRRRPAPGKAIRGGWRRYLRYTRGC